MHGLALVLVACAGAAFCVSAGLRLHRLRRGTLGGSSTVLWLGLGLLTVGLLVSLAEGGHRDLAYALLGVWACIAAVLFIGRFLAAPSRGLLVLPIGAVALLVAMAGALRLGGKATDAVTRLGDMPAITVLHIAFMCFSLAALVAAGAVGGLYLLAQRLLKHDSTFGLRLPPLPRLEALTERALVTGTGLLFAGLATGGAAMQLSADFSLAHPTVLIGIVALGLLVLALALRAAGRLPRGRLAAIAVYACMLIAIGAASAVVVRHG